MQKCFFLLLFFVFTLGTATNAQHNKSGQPVPSATYDYYIFISGVKERADVEIIENNIRNKNGVSYFMGNRYPVRYFLLKSNNPVTQSQFNTWINQDRYKIEYFGEGEYAKERAIITGNKLKQIQ
jgi:hypothetical protein